MLGVIDYYLRDLSRGIGRISKGQVPDGSGNPLVPNLGDFFYLPGRAGGQIGYGDRNPSGTLTLHSTNNATKGAIILGSGTTVVVDEANNRLGIGTSSPAAKLDIQQPGTDQTLYPVSDAANPSNVFHRSSDAGTTNLWTMIDEVSADPSDYIYSDLGQTGIQITVATCAAQAASATITINGSFQWVGTNSGAVGVTILGYMYRSDGTVVVNGETVGFTGTGFNGTYSVNWTHVLSPAEIGIINATGGHWAGLRLGFSTSGGGVGYTPGAAPCRWTWGNIVISGATATDLVRWSDTGLSLAGHIDSSGNLGIGIGSTAPSAVGHFKSRAAANVVVMADSSSGQTGDLFQGIVNSVVFGKLTSAGAWSGRSLVLNGSTAGTLTHTVPATVTTYSLAWPSAQGTDNSLLANDGAGALSWTDTFSSLKTFDASVVGANPHILVANAGSDPFIRIVDAANSANYIEFLGPGTALSGANTITFPISGTLVGTTAAQNLTNKSISTATPVNLTAQTADIGATSLTLNITNVGQYLVEVYAMTTTADATAGILTATIGWTDTVGATTQVALTLSLAVTGRASGSVLLKRASGNITYATTHTGIYGTAQYALSVRALNLIA